MMGSFKVLLFQNPLQQPRFLKKSIGRCQPCDGDAFPDYFRRSNNLRLGDFLKKEANWRRRKKNGERHKKAYIYTWRRSWTSVKGTALRRGFRQEEWHVVRASLILRCS